MLVLEVLSASTYETDQSTKKLSYAEMGAAEYWLFDPTGKLQVPRLQGFQLADGRYVPIPGSGESKEHAVHGEILSADLYLEDQAVRLASATGQDVPTMSASEELWKERIVVFQIIPSQFVRFGRSQIAGRYCRKESQLGCRAID